jgi:hypothetical protein
MDNTKIEIKFKTACGYKGVSFPGAAVILCNIIAAVFNKEELAT